MKSLLFILFSFSALTLSAQKQDEKTVRDLLQKQNEAWNLGNIDEFMKGYWNSDSLMFIGKNGVTYGYNNVLNNYKKNYSDTVKMGKLAFDILQVRKMSAENCWVLGKWFLKRSEGGDLGGYFTLLFRKINGRWVIVADHTS